MLKPTGCPTREQDGVPCGFPLNQLETDTLRDVQAEEDKGLGRYPPYSPRIISPLMLPGSPQDMYKCYFLRLTMYGQATENDVVHVSQSWAKSKDDDRGPPRGASWKGLLPSP